MNWAAALFWLAIVAAASRRGPALLYLMTIAGAFGTLQMLPGSGSGGANLLPQTACAAFFVCKILLQRGNLIRAFDVAVDPSRMGLFTSFIVYAMITAMILPRLFAGQIEVVPVSGFVAGTDILTASFGNVTQSFYLLLSFAVSLTMAVIAKGTEAQHYIRRSMIVGALALIATGFLDLVCYHLGLSSVLDPFRTATYALLTDVEAAGAKRVVGLMPEASSYGSACVTTLATLTFLRPLFKTPREQQLVLGLMGVLAAMAMLSTSSSAYVGLAVLAPVYGLHLAVRLHGASASTWAVARGEIVIILCVMLVLFATVVLHPAVLEPVKDLLNKIIFDKTSTSSFAERSMWTRVGLQAMFDTGGLGVGLGSIRTSNWFVSILGSTGLFGGLLIFGFIAYLFVSRLPSGPNGAFGWALRCSLVPALVMVALSGTIPDIGIGIATSYGLLAGLSLPLRARPSAVREVAGRTIAA